MKKVLGLDLGVASIGWAMVNQAENNEEKSSIIKAGVRIVPLDSSETDNFEKGKPCETNADRRRYRSMRRNLQRYKLRKSNLKEVLKEAGFIGDNTFLAEHTNKSTFETYRLRSKAVKEPVSLEEFSRILLMINKKRGYKSNRKTVTADEGQALNGIDVAKQLKSTGQTPGQYAFSIVKSGKKNVPQFYPSDLKTELDRIWAFQKSFYPDILTDAFRETVEGKGMVELSKVFNSKFGIDTADNRGKDRKYRRFEWRDKALSEKLPAEVLAYVIADICNELKKSSGYLGAISDRSKELLLRDITVGQYLYEKIQADPHFSLRNLVFYRNDYIDEFNKLWKTQSGFHKELTPELEAKIRDEIIFYQRRLKSQKHLVSFCEFEGRKMKVMKDGVEKEIMCGPRVAPKSSLVFQEFKIWQILNNLVVTDKETGEQRTLSLEERQRLADELRIKDKMSSKDVLKFLFGSKSRVKDLNYKSIEGNSTYRVILSKFLDIANEAEGTEYDLKKMTEEEAIDAIRRIFDKEGFNKQILEFDSSLPKEAFERQPLFQIWHLLYSYEGDDSVTGDQSLIDKLGKICGMPEDAARELSTIAFKEDYGSLSHKAMRKILPFLKQGYIYSDACEKAGYNHSERSRTKEQLQTMELVQKLAQLPKNSLHNPIVEKILNQMINVVNAVSQEYGRPDEIHIEFARELKKNQEQRKKMAEDISARERDNSRVEAILKDAPFNLRYVRKNDILRYRLYEELENNAYKTLYSDKYIPKELLFSNSIDIEHIIPQAVLFDDSYSNKTLEYKDVNIEKGNMTARDYVSKKGEDAYAAYKAKVENLLYKGAISAAKCSKLLMRKEDLPTDFIERDLVNSRYIAREATRILESYVRRVMPTNGAITAKLREDWQLVDIMKEMNLRKYSDAGLTHYEQHGEHRAVEKIDEWSKRDDHRHHAMDAITIAFTKPSHIQYLNYTGDKSVPSSPVYGIRQKETVKIKEGKRIFMPPMPLDELRSSFKRELESVLVSVKAKNKVVTRNVNKTRKREGYNVQNTLTPRGRLHKETIYGARKQYKVYDVPVGAKLTEETIHNVASMPEREALLKRLHAFGGDPKKAFTGSNSPAKNPIWLDAAHSAKIEDRVKCVSFDTKYSVRKELGAGLNIDKVLDAKVRSILKARLDEFGGNAAKAFANLEENPVWLNKEKGIAIKKVTIAESFDLDNIRVKHDNKGNVILDPDGMPEVSDFVNFRNNHHVAIFKTGDGKYQEHVVSFFEALDRINHGLPAVDKEYKQDEGWEFLFSMKKNEMFVFPNPKTGFDPHDIDLTNPRYYQEISPNLFRVQKLSRGIYNFRHHQDTGIEEIKELRDINWKRISNPEEMAQAVKVRVNNIGLIVAVGEYD